MGVKIIMAVCFLPVLFLMFGIFYVEGKRKGKILFGITLWDNAWEDSRVQAIQKRFFKEMKLLLLAGIVTFAVTCIPSRTCIAISAQMIWLLFVLVIYFLPVVWANRRMQVLKTEVVGEPAKHIETIAVDIKALTQKKGNPFLKLSVVGVLCGVIAVIVEVFLVKSSFYGWWTLLTLVSLLLCDVLLLVIQYSYGRLRTEVVSYENQVNIQIGRVRQYQWSRFWSIMVWCNTAFLYVMWLGMHREKALVYLVVLGVIFYTAVIFLAAVITERNIRKVCDKHEIELTSPEDDDRYWVYGMFYYNKNDKRFMVNKRVGMGTTVNMAKTSAKVMTFGSYILIGVMLVGAAAILLLTEFAPVSVTVTPKAVVSSQYKEEYSIPLEEIETVELVEELPSLSKRVGTATESILKGSFLTEEYASCKACVRRTSSPYVKITTVDGMTYYFNQEEAAATQAVYDTILEEIQD